MDDTTKIIVDYYNSTVQSEWERIAGRPEFLLTCRFLDRYIQPKDTVLDIGGGPGRYAFALAKKGAKVTLLDLAPENIRFAEKYASENGLDVRCAAGDAREAGALFRGAFDHVLLMGPMYHLLKEEDRVKAMSAALGLLKPGGTIFVSFLNAFAGIIYYMKFLPDISADPGGEEYVKKVLEGKSFASDAFTKVFFTNPGDIAPFMAGFPLTKLCLFGQEGVMSPCEGTIMTQRREVADMWLRLSEELCVREEYLNFSEHLMYIGRKNKEKM